MLYELSVARRELRGFFLVSITYYARYGQQLFMHVTLATDSTRQEEHQGHLPIKYLMKMLDLVHYFLRARYSQYALTWTTCYLDFTFDCAIEYL